MNSILDSYTTSMTQISKISFTNGQFNLTKFSEREGRFFKNIGVILMNNKPIKLG